MGGLRRGDLASGWLPSIMIMEEELLGTNTAVNGIKIHCYYTNAYSPDDFIHSLGATYWGFWGQTEACPLGSFARSFELKVESEHLLGDNTSLNAIRLNCYNITGEFTGSVTSSTMNWGSWTGVYSCAEGDFLGGYDLKSQPDQGALGDNTAANALRMYCKSQGENNYLESPGTKWGAWLGPKFCRARMAVCGLMTLVQENQGNLSDDTALNDVRFLCCDLPE